MRYHVLATDYDGTLAHDGRVKDETLRALERLLKSGRHAVLVTGRELHDILRILPEIKLFTRVVAENGAVVYRPGTKERLDLGESPPPGLVDVLRRRNIPLSVGKSIIATWRPHEMEVLAAIHEQGLEWQVIFNKDAVMALPASVNKATGLSAALKELCLSAHEVVGIGDAENDHAFLGMCECGVAVANALPAVKDRADWVTPGDHGDGVRELIDEMIDTDLSRREDRLIRHHLLLGRDDQARDVRISPYGPGVLIAGANSESRRMAAMTLLGRLSEHKYQFCVIDPDGSFSNLAQAVTLGSEHHAPSVEEVINMASAADENVVINLAAVASHARSSFLAALLPQFCALRDRTGRPHWLAINEADQFKNPEAANRGQALNRTIVLAQNSEQVPASILAGLKWCIALDGSVSVVKNLTAEI